MSFRLNMYPSKQKPDSVRPVYNHLQIYEPAKYSKQSRYRYIDRFRSEHKVHPNPFDIQAFEQSRAKLCHTTVPRIFIPKSEYDQYYEVTAVTENRLDSVAAIHYGDPKLWWLIAAANPSIRFNPLEISRGTVLRIPPATTAFEGGVI